MSENRSSGAGKQGSFRLHPVAAFIRCFERAYSAGPTSVRGVGGGIGSGRSCTRFEENLFNGARRCGHAQTMPLPMRNRHSLSHTQFVRPSTQFGRPQSAVAAAAVTSTKAQVSLIIVLKIN